MESSVRRSNAPAYVTMLFFCLTGVVCGYFAVVLAKAIPIFVSFTGNTIFYSIALLLWAVTALGLHSIIHEAGHLVFGLLSGYSFLSFRVFSLTLIKKETGFGFCRQKLPGTLGQCLMNPPKGKPYTEIPYKLYNLGGVIANYITAFICVITVLFCKNSLAFALLLIFAVQGIMLAITNGFPFKNTGLPNDGENVRILSNSMLSRKAFIMQLEINGALTSGKRLKDTPIEWFTLPDDADKNSITCAIRTFAVGRLMDEGKTEDARCLINTLLTDSQALIDIHKSQLSIELLYCELVTENRDDEVKKLLSPDVKFAMNTLSKFPSTIRTEYAYALLHEHDEGKAERTRAAFETVAKYYPYKGDIESERELMDRALDIFNSSQNKA